ncbi:MAG: hypothetical protein JWN83_464 [Chitinophagaceae bacterium]|nr:hypothetical protein [Chitinophagaceae bacterium]
MDANIIASDCFLLEGSAEYFPLTFFREIQPAKNVEQHAYNELECGTF